MRKIFLLLVSLLCFSGIYAQYYTGKVADEQTGQPLIFANVVLLQIADSAFVAGTATDTLGNFTINATIGNYILKVSSVGYLTKFINVNLDNLGTITLSSDMQNLEGVTVTATLPIYKMENGGISTDIQNSRLKEIGTAADVLGQLPLVTKDGSNYTVFGKGTPLIYINNRLVRDPSDLERINSEQIKKVTVITNPSAEYDASVKSVIKIEIIKHQDDGLSGGVTFSTNSKLFKTFGHDERVDLNFKKNQFNIFGTFLFGKGADFQNYNSISNLNQPNRLLYINTVGKLYESANSFATRIGTIYSLNKKNELGVRYDFSKSPNYIKDYSDRMNVYINENTINDITSHVISKENSYTNYINTYYNSEFTDWLSSTLNIDFVSGNKDNNQKVSNLYNSQTEKNETESNQKYNLFAAKLVFNAQFGKNNFDYGMEYSYTNNNQNLNIIEVPDTLGILQPSNNNAKQNLFAAFAIYNLDFNKFTINAGLRYEYVEFKYFVYNQLQNSQSKSSNNFFPNLNITYSTDNMQFMAGYNRSISRPSYWQLRNDIMYDGPYNYESGNPFLQPILDNSFSTSIKWENILLSANYDVLKNYIISLPELYTQDIVLYKFENIENVQNLSLSVLYSTTISFWQPSLELNLQKQFLNVDNQIFDTPIFYVKFKNNLKII